MNVTPIYAMLASLAFVACFYVGNLVGYMRGRRDARELEIKLRHRGN